MKRILVGAVILGVMLVLVPETAFIASGTPVTGGTAFMNIADALAIICGVPGYEQACRDLQDKLVNGRIYTDPDLEGQRANTDGNDRITIKEEYVSPKRRWDLNEGKDYESALGLASTLVHEWKHEQQNPFWRGVSNLWDYIAGNPIEQQAYIEKFTFIDALIKKMFEDIAKKNLNHPDPDLVQELKRLELALGEKVVWIEVYDSDLSSQYGPIPWTADDWDFFFGIMNGIGDLRRKAEDGEPVPRDEFNRLRDSYNNREDEIEQKRQAALQEVEQEVLQAIEKIEQIDSKTIDPTIPITTPIGDTDKALITIYNPYLPYPGDISMYAPKQEYLSLFESIGGFKVVGGPVGIGPSGQTFSEEVTITIKYKPEANPNTIDVYCYKNGVWQKITTGKTVDRVNRTISVQVTQLTGFAVLEPVPVGGIIELPQIEEPGTAIPAPDSSGHNYGALAGIIAGAIAGVTALISAAWYVRRRRTKAM